MTKKRTGVYLMGSFRKGKKAFSYFDIIKPFEIDNVEGVINPKPIHFFKETIWFNEWFFFEGEKLKTFSDSAKEVSNDLWRDWCKKYKRKYKPIFDSTLSTKNNKEERHSSQD